MSQGGAILLDEYQTFLRENGKIQENRIKFYIYWTQKFLKFCGYKSENLGMSTIKRYLDTLDADKNIVDWQVKQAADAVIMYVGEFLGKAIGNSEDNNTMQKQSYEKLTQAWHSAIQDVRKSIRLRHYSFSTEKTYTGWITRFALYMKDKRPEEIDSDDITGYLTHIAIRKKVSASTQNQAFNSLLFLSKHVLKCSIRNIDTVVRAKRNTYLPVVLSAEEVKRLFSCMSGLYLLMAQLLYGCGLRLAECLRLRVKDIDFANHLIIVRSGKGGKDRSLVLPEIVREPLRNHLVEIKRIHEKDIASGYGEVALPNALDKKNIRKREKAGYGNGFSPPRHFPLNRGVEK